jgi:DNA-binding HxlR family transcriptional regulator
MRAPLDTPTVAGRPCSIAAALEIVGDRWSLLIVREVHFGNHRFSEIARYTGAPRDRLAARLKELVAAGVLERREYQSAPPRSGYHLTAAGRDLIPVLQSLLQWGDKWAVDEPSITVRHHDHELSTGRTCDVCGERLHRGDLTRVSNRPDWAAPVATG